MASKSLLGKRVPRVDAVSKVTGEAKYTFDIFLPKMLFGKILRSPHPHALIHNIDISKASKLTGVKAIITRDDFKVREDDPNLKFCAIDLAPQFWDTPPLAIKKVRFIGDEVAAVAAKDEETAEEALELIEVDYKELPPVYDPEEAMIPDAPRIHDKERNISEKRALIFGDAEKGFQESFCIVEDEYQTQLISHCCLETHNAVARFDPSGKLTLWTSTQVPFKIRQQLARVLNISEAKVRVIKPHVGGGFGSKAELFPLEVCSALLSMKSGRSVKISLTREEEFMATRYRHPVKITLKTGAKKDGTLLAEEGHCIMDGGAYNSWGPLSTSLLPFFLTIPYRIPNIKYESIRVYTNKPPCGALRGHTGPQAHFAHELQLEKLAQELNMDPLEFRIKNALQAWETTVTGLKITSCGFSECLEKVGEIVDWEKKYGNTKKYKGIGIGGSCCASGATIPLIKAPGPFPGIHSMALINIQENGIVHLLCGGADIGQGLDTIIAQITADELGLGMEDIQLTTADTDLTPMDMGSFSSRGTFFNGN
ncbi:MAG: molybdopterin-dependent oxidoreductase, partial [Deltaproteobacteria bacterium]|nr:molybdopterin-dependent oxidoreductase [Deltaproteobacteria bacterium]